jgi:hypothetical protein
VNATAASGSQGRLVVGAGGETVAVTPRI